MPYPAQVSREAIIETAYAMLEDHGIDQFSLGKLASELGVKTPSLYRHVANKNALFRAVNTVTAEKLIEHIRGAIENVDDDVVQQTVAMADAFRAFALAHPVTYMLAYNNVEDERRPDESFAEALALPLQVFMAKISGVQYSLPALRGLWALVHGFVMLELSEQFRRGGDVDEAFHLAVQAYVAGWQQTPEP